MNTLIRVILIPLLLICFIQSYSYAQDDRAIFDLKGKATSVSSDYYDYLNDISYMNAEFSDKGTLKSLGPYDMSEPNGTYFVKKRRGDGRIAEIEYVVGDGIAVIAFEYSKKGVVDKYYLFMEDYETGDFHLYRWVERTFRRGRPVKEIVYNSDGELVHIFTYKYKEVDKEGNWLQRVASCKSYVNEFDFPEQIQKREIGYEHIIDDVKTYEYDQIPLLLDSLTLPTKKKAPSTKRPLREYTLLILIGLIIAVSIIDWVVRRMRLVCVNKEIFCAKRKRKSLPDESSEEENQRCISMLTEAIDKNTRIYNINGHTIIAPSNRFNVLRIRKALAAVRKISPTNEDVIKKYNDIIYILESTTRSFAGNKTYIISSAIVLTTLFLLLGVGGLNTPIWFRPIPAIAFVAPYFFGSLRKKYIIYKKAEKAANSGKKRGVLSSVMASLWGEATANFEFYDKEKYEKGKKEKAKVDIVTYVYDGWLVHNGISLILLIMLFFLIPWLAVINFVRFYILE